MKKHNTIIIGAGLTGLSCAHYLEKDYLLVEKEDEPGGIVRTRIRAPQLGGFACDGTGHWLHLRSPEIRELVARILPNGLVEYERRAAIHMQGCFTAFPFQANTFGLPAQTSMECVLGFLQARHPEDFGLPAPTDEPRNFRECLERLFGPGICNHFMIPYNEKLMGVKLEEISANYATRFIPKPSLEDVIKGAFGFSREALGYNAKFVYPKSGGIGALPKALATSLSQEIRYKTVVTSISPEEKTVTFESGDSAEYEYLLNTMPLVRLLQAVDKHLPPSVRNAAARLRSTTVWYFDVGVRGKGGPRSSYHWVYFPEPDYIFYRAGSYSAVHANCAPPGCRSYYVEMSGGLGDLLSRPEELKRRVLEGMRKAELLVPEDEVLFMELSSIPHAYVIFDSHYESARAEVVDWLETQNILTHGRWGGWNYGGMEDALLEGRSAALQINRQ
jgi:protoporphyrinogen oxidase